jgi:hypothetical protein
MENTANQILALTSKKVQNVLAQYVAEIGQGNSSINTLWFRGTAGRGSRASACNINHTIAGFIDKIFLPNILCLLFISLYLQEQTHKFA